MSSRRRRFAISFILATAGTVGVVCNATPAQAGAVTWANYANGNLMLDVWQSNPNNGAIIDVWPSNGSSAQKWWDTPVSGPYWEEQNVISWKALDRYNDQYCVVTDWDYWGGAQQLWKEKKVASGQWQLINEAGCNGNGYWDAATTNQNPPAAEGPNWLPRSSNVILRTEYDCGSPGGEWQELTCFWH